MENGHKSLLEKIEALEKELHQLITRLQQSLAKIRQLSGLLPICASYKKIRDDKGYWNQPEISRAEIHTYALRLDAKRFH